MDSNKISTNSLTIQEKFMNNELLKDLKTSNIDFDDLNLTIINLKKDEVLYRQGEPSDSIYLVIEGEIKLVKNEPTGKMQFLIPQNSYFGQEEYFLKTNRNSAAAAYKNSVVVELSHADIEALLAHDNKFLNAIINSVLVSYPAKKNDFDHAIEGLPDNPGKLVSTLPMELTINNKKNKNGSTQNRILLPESGMSPIRNDLSKIESGIKNIIKNIDKNLTLLEEERDKLKASVSDYKKDYQKLLNEIERLRDQEVKFIHLEKEKNDILGKQSYRIIELEKENAKVREFESEYSKRIEQLSEQEEKVLIKTKELENELLEKENIISKLNNELTENKKTISELYEAKSTIGKKADEQDLLIRKQKVTLIESAEKIESLTSELSANEKSVTYLSNDLQNKNQLISAQSDKLITLKADKEELGKSLDKKEEILQTLTSKLKDLQSQLDHQKEIEKNKNEYIFNQSHKISEYEEYINNSKKELSRKDETIENFTKDIGELSENVWQKQYEINDQNAVIVELNEEIKNLKDSEKDFVSLESNLKQEINQLKSQLSSASYEMDTLTKKINEETKLVEQKETENKNLNSHLSEVISDLEESKNILESRNIKINELVDIISGLRDELSNNSKVESLNEQINNFNNEIEKYRLHIEEKDKIIEEQNTNNKNLKESKSAIIKTLTSAKSKYEEDLNKKDIEIENLKNEAVDLKKTLEEKACNEEQQSIIIDNQAQKIADLEIKVSESSVRIDNQETVKKEIAPENVSNEEHPEEQIKTIEEDGFLSECTLVAAESTSTFFDDKGLEHFKYSDVNIININLSRATLDMASVFNKFLIGIISKERKNIVVNLSACNYIDSSILGALVSGVKKARTFEGDLRIVFISQSEYSMFSLTKMDSIFKIFSDLKDAVMSY